ncbi:MAG: ATP-dependent zinc protease [Runella slithyformis]|nr:MAG: ATP-dependent zinc protease [Runella slithyformis]TAF26747.1 MAG: ATP-dependent zinc protease [Runella slithyformis]TAF45426.1 MAG: ATP-dependent zinc protease [Runella slithyformis]
MKKVVKNKISKPLIGRTDSLDFPEWGLTNVRAKIDTGAYTSAIHCTQIKLLKNNKLSFDLPAHKGQKKQRFVAEEFEFKSVKNSFGQAELRYVVKTSVVVFGKTIKTEFSLADRTSMRFPVLLGRKFLRNRFLVDVTLENLSLLQKQRQLTKT